MERVTVQQAAKEIGCAPEYLRRQMKAGRWPIGEVVKPPRGSTQYRYFIFRPKLDKFLGREVVVAEETDIGGGGLTEEKAVQKDLITNMDLNPDISLRIDDIGNIAEAKRDYAQKKRVNEH